MNRKSGRLRITAISVLTFILVFTSVMAAWATVGEDYSDKTKGNYVSLLYNSRTGLPTSEANDIDQTDDGFIWFGGYSGLIRYDGVNFDRIIYDGITSVNVLHTDAKGRLWVGTNDSGVAIRNSDTDFKFFSKADGFRSSSVRSICEFKDGTMIVGTTEGIYFIEDDSKVVPLEDKRLYSKYICCLDAENGNTCVGVTTTGDLFRIKNRKVIDFVEYTEETAQPISVAVSPEKELWIGTDRNEILVGNFRDGVLDAETKGTDILTNINKIRFSGSKPWVCSDTGIGCFTNGELNIIDCEMNNSVDSMSEDAEGNLWFASSRQGVLKLTLNRFTNIFESLGIESTVVNATLVNNGILYMGTDTGMRAADISKNTLVENSLTKALGETRVRCLLRDSKGKIWACSYGGLFCMDKGGNITKLTTEDGLLTEKVRSAIELSDGRFAVATSSGLCIVENGKVTETYNEEQGLTNVEVLSVCEKPDGDLLLGTDGGGLFLLKDKKISEVDFGGTELSSDVIMKTHYDKDYDGYWLVTGNSLMFYDGETVREFDKFPYNNNFDVITFDNDFMWVLCSGGIYIIEKSNLFNDDEDLEYALYKYDDGLTDSITANSFSCIDNGILYLCCSQGIYSIGVNSTSSQFIPELRIPKVFADGVEIPVVDGKVEVPASCSRLVIDCYALTYTLQDPTISYMLEGVDEEETIIQRSDLGEVRYTNLKGGTYTFDFAVIDPITGEEITSMPVEITKKKLITESIFFFIFLLAAIAVLMALIFRAINKRKLEQAQKKQKEARNLTSQIIKTFSKVIDAKDRYTNGHSVRVAEYSRIIADAMGMDEDRVEDVYNIALLHDIGKLGIPDEILNKNGPLTDEEFAIMKTHTDMGAEILSEIEVLPEIALGARYHHERYGGGGYMEGLVGEDIPQIARIISAADAFDAMNSTRVYRKHLSAEKIMSELETCKGTQFDPEIANVLIKLIKDGRVELASDEEVEAQAKAREEAEAKAKAEAAAEPEAQAEAEPQAETEPEA